MWKICLLVLRVKESTHAGALTFFSLYLPRAEENRRKEKKNLSFIFERQKNRKASHYIWAYRVEYRSNSHVSCSSPFLSHVKSFIISFKDQKL